MSSLGIYTSVAFRNASGLIVAANATIEVRNESDSALASIYSDRAGTIPIAQPGFVADADGYFEFYAAGRLDGYRVAVTYASVTKTLRYQSTGTARELDVSQVTTLAMAVQQALTGMVDMLHISSVTGHRDLIRGGWTPAFFNQQWGGAPHYFEMLDTATGVPYRFEAATGNVDDDSILNGMNLANVAAQTWRSNGFKVSKNTTLAAIWVKMWKTSNPTDNVELRILPDDGTGKPSGSTAITNGTATAINGKVLNAQFGWVRFVFPTPPSLTAGTQYHFTLKRSGAVDVTNYYLLSFKINPTNRYPFGKSGYADATPTWLLDNHCIAFLAEVAAADESLQAGGFFSDGKLNFFEGTPLAQSNARAKDLRDFTGLNLSDFTVLVRGTAWTKDKTILDILYGLDHDRIVLRANTSTGFAQVDVYDSAGTKRTVTSASVDLSSGNHDVAVRVRAKGDGNDRIDLYVDGAANGTPVTGASFSFDQNFSRCRLGTMWLGGGFALAPTWTKDTTMATLPSADGWTWTGAATESACMSVSGGKLFQNRQGYGVSGDGYYAKTSLSFSNANGWAAAWKSRIAYNTNTKDEAGADFVIFDGTKVFAAHPHEYFVVASTGISIYPQVDLRTLENAMYAVGKGTDALHFCNGRLIGDLSTIMTASAGAVNGVHFGDRTTTAGENADVVWDYVKYYTTAWLPPQVTGGSLSEFAIWVGDLTSFMSALWNAGSPVSVKQVCRLAVNHGPEVVQRRSIAGITIDPAISSTSYVIAPEMEMFAIGSRLDVRSSQSPYASTVGAYVRSATHVDGGRIYEDHGTNYQVESESNPGASYLANMSNATFWNVQFGLHKVDQRVSVTAGSINVRARALSVEARA